MAVANFKSLTVAFVVAALWLDSAERLDAMPSPEQHEMSGTVQHIDAKTLTVSPDGSSVAVVFAWNSEDTKFLNNRVFTTVDSLRVGTHVTIRCSHPIFGSPLLYRVSWQTTASKRKTSDK
jgi:hypothetical protein